MNRSTSLMQAVTKRYLNMPVLVWDGSNLATDRQANDGSAKWESSKAWYVTIDNEVCIVSGVGLLDDIIKMREWIKQSGVPQEFPALTSKSELIVVRRDTGLWLYEGIPFPVHCGFNPRAFGHGKDFAYGAVAMGANAQQAVEASNMFCLHCGKGVEVFNLNGEGNEKENNKEG